jgi:hypothetical protein
VPDVTVELGRFTGFILDDPVQGTLDDNVLDGEVAFDQIPQGVVSVSTSRGRNRDLERTNAGSLSVSLRNQDRFFDPRGGSVFAPFVEPRNPVRVQADGTPVFTGLIDDWSFTYSPGGDSVASFQASDAFALFARNLNDGGAAPEELTGARLNRVLDQVRVNWPALDRDIDDGNSTLEAGNIDDNTLNYLGNVVEASEQGLVFMSKDGKVAFRERLTTPTLSPVEFRDDGLGVPYEDVQISFGTDLMVNQVLVTAPDGTAISEDTTSQLKYGIIERTLDTQLSTLSQAEGIADYILGRYANPEYRVESVTVNLRTLTPEQLGDVLELELGDQARLVFTPNAVGSAISVANRVIGVSHDVGFFEHRVTFNLEVLPFTFFILDDLEFGILDGEGVLGF